MGGRQPGGGPSPCGPVVTFRLSLTERQHHLKPLADWRPAYHTPFEAELAGGKGKLEATVGVRQPRSPSPALIALGIAAFLLLVVLIIAAVWWLPPRLVDTIAWIRGT